MYIATLVIDIVAIVMTAIMIYHIRSKYTAVGKFIYINNKTIKMYTHILLQQQKVVRKL